MDLVCLGQFTCPGSRLSIRRRHVRFDRPTICRVGGSHFSCRGHHCELNGAHDEQLYRYVVMVTLPRFTMLMKWWCIAGMALSGVGAGVNELTALAVASELAPTRKRGQYVAALIFTIVPFCPSVLWGQLIASHSNWRYVGLFCGVWAFIGFAMTAIFYFPPPRANSSGLSRREIISRIDFVGGLLSISGMILFLAGILWGGYQVRFRDYASLRCPRLVADAFLH